jgi:hypothetical protein
MNERIKELAEQATQEFSPAFDRAKWQDKFAELIVRQYAKIVTIWSDEEPCGEGYDILPVAKMKDHFGVE